MWLERKRLKVTLNDFFFRIWWANRVCRSRFCLLAKLFEQFTIEQGCLEYRVSKEPMEMKSIPDRFAIVLFVSSSIVSIDMILIGVSLPALCAFERKLESRWEKLDLFSYSYICHLEQQSLLPVLSSSEWADSSYLFFVMISNVVLQLARSGEGFRTNWTSMRLGIHSHRSDPIRLTSFDERNGIQSDSIWSHHRGKR